MAKKQSKKSIGSDFKKRSYMSQVEFTSLSLAKALKVAQALWENYAGKGAAPHEVALALEYSPTSGRWRTLCGASIAYGLTEGGYNANEIKLSDLGRSIVAPTNEEDDVRGKVQALLKPRIIRAFYEKYDKAKFPKENIAKNVLISLGVPQEKAQSSFKIIHENGIFTGVLKKTKTGLFVALGSPTPVAPPLGELEEQVKVEETEPSEEEGTEVIAPSREEALRQKNNKVFVSHGKNKSLVEPIKKLLQFGELEPVVSVEKQSVSQPVSDKVLSDMRSCGAAIIHVEVEHRLIDKEAKEHVTLNPNVLIEIGAAMALYGRRFILLVKEGVKLPSNLQGLYEVRYSGDTLDGNDTIKLLEAINEMKKEKFLSI